MQNAVRKHDIDEEKGTTHNAGGCKAIDPCELCSHRVYIAVDPRCKTCGLRGRRFFEVVHALKQPDA